MFERGFKQWLGQIRKQITEFGQNLLQSIRRRKLSSRQVYVRLFLVLALIPTILIGYQNCGPADQFKPLTLEEMRAASLATQSHGEEGADGSSTNLPGGELPGGQAPPAEIRELQFDDAEIGPSPSKSMAMRTVGVKVKGYQYYKVAVVTDGKCSSADFANAHEQDVSDQYLFTPQNNAANKLCAMARTDKGNYDQAPIFDGPTLVIDTEGPVPAKGLEDGKMFGSLSQSTSLSWKAASDESGVAFYEVALFSLADHKQITEFVDVGSETSYQFNNLSLIEGGEYYFQVKAYDPLGNWSLSEASDGWTVDMTIPVVTAVRTLVPDGFYTKVGSSIDIEVVFSQLMTVEGVPSLELPIGQANYLGSKVENVGGATSSILIFRYIIKAGDEMAKLDYTSVDSLLVAPGQSIRSRANLLNAALELPAPGAVNSLSWQKAVGIDTVAPRAPVVTSKPIFVYSLQASPLLTWTEAEDFGSGIDHYEVAIYNGETNAEILAFENVGAVLKARIQDLSFQENQNYYFKVRAIDRVGWASPSTQSQNWPAKIKQSFFAGREYSCGTAEDGTLKCWGDNDYGQVGDGTTTDRNTPTIIDPGTSYLSVTPGLYHTCGITTSGTLKCWGWNYYGQVGDGTKINRNTPTNIDPGTSYQSVTLGSFHTCGITTSGTLKCWGYNYYGQVGDGTTTNRPTPTNIDPGTSYQSVTPGSYHTCGITTSGTLKCWGGNNYGQVGDGTKINRNTPTNIDPGTSYQSVTLGSFHTCGITTSGTLKCWGYNYYGQVGDGTTTNRPTPTNIDPGTSYQSVTPGSYHTCGITTSGTLKCWGGNNYGQVGDGTKINRNTPTNIDPGTSYQSVTLGSFHTCGITTSGTLKCWGYNYYGQVGDGTTTNRPTPTNIDPGTSYLSVVTPGSSHTCGITTSGTLKCWGVNESGQVGDGTTTNRPTPTAVDLDR